MRPLNLYPYNLGDDVVTRTTPKALNNFNKIVFVVNDQSDFFINNIKVMTATFAGFDYTFTIGETGEYNFADQLQFSGSSNVGFIAYQGKAMSTKQIQLDYGNIDSIQTATKILNLTGAIKCTLLYDSANALVINGQRVIQGSGTGLITAIPIGDSKTIINDQIDLTNSINVGYIIERLI